MQHLTGRGGRRRPSRVVQIFGIDRAGKAFSERAVVLEYGPAEVLLEDVRAPLRPEDIVGLRYGERKVRFRVTWAARPGSTQQGQVRVRTIEPTKDLWGEALPESLGGQRFPSALEATLLDTEPKWQGRNRRRHGRVPCHGTVRYHLQGSHAPAFASLRDLSVSGCYVETTATMPKTSQLDLSLQVESLQLRSFGIVQACNPGYGMGIEFMDMKDNYRGQLEQWIARHC